MRTSHTNNYPYQNGKNQQIAKNKEGKIYFHPLAKKSTRETNIYVHTNYPLIYNE
jgi:hypothetical protein